jgi:hypothetical protein
MYTEMAHNPSTNEDGPSCRVRNVNANGSAKKKASKK